jgi:hypothetical protein
VARATAALPIIVITGASQVYARVLLPHPPTGRNTFPGPGRKPMNGPFGG